MEEVHYSETSVTIYQTTWHHIPEDSTFSYHPDELKSYKYSCAQNCMYHVWEIHSLATILSLPRHASHVIFCVHIRLNMPGTISHTPSPYYLLPDKQLKLLAWSPAILIFFTAFLSPFRQMLGQHIN
jgi:hypothetical protein